MTVGYRSLLAFWLGGAGVLAGGAGVWMLALLPGSAGATVQSGLTIGVIGSSVMAGQSVDVVGAGVLGSAERLPAGSVVEG